MGNDYRLYVGNLSYDATDEDLRELGERFGTPTYARVALDHDSGRSRGFAFLGYATEQQQLNAIRGVNGLMHMGRVLRADRARSNG